MYVVSDWRWAGRPSLGEMRKAVKWLITTLRNVEWIVSLVEFAKKYKWLELGGITMTGVALKFKDLIESEWQLALGLAVVAGCFYMGWKSRRNKLFDASEDVERSSFDMPINAAIAHVLEHNPSTAVSRLDAEMKALNGIFKLAKEGELAMAGSLDEGVPPAQIPRKRLQHLRSLDMVIPRSEEAPEGHVYGLAPRSPPNELREYRRNETEIYTNLLVQSSEFYRHWPKTGDFS